MRMAMDFVVYLIVLGVYMHAVIWDITSDTSADIEHLTDTEIFLAVYVTVSAAKRQ